VIGVEAFGSLAEQRVCTCELFASERGFTPRSSIENTDVDLVLRRMKCVLYWIAMQ